MPQTPRSSHRQTDLHTARKARLVAIVLVATIGLWMGTQVLGSVLGLNPRYVFLIDFAALAAFVWSLFVIFQLWQARKSTAGPPNRG